MSMRSEQTATPLTSRDKPRVTRGTVRAFRGYSRGTCAMLAQVHFAGSPLSGDGYDEHETRWPEIQCAMIETMLRPERGFAVEFRLRT